MAVRLAGSCGFAGELAETRCQIPDPVLLTVVPELIGYSYPQPTTILVYEEPVRQQREVREVQLISNDNPIEEVMRN